jgi:signal transduction histidine kinase
VAERAAIEALSDAVGAVAGVLDLDAVLQLIVDRVRVLVGARYAALAIVSHQRRIESFITSGITAAERAALGDPPQGHGVLGLIISEGRSIRIPEVSAHPASVGFPPNHPTMHSLLGVPVQLKGRTIGNLYLADKVDAPEFGDDDQRLVELFALHAAIAIENARLHVAVQRLAVVDERDRIGKDLHDGIIQSLYGIALSLEHVPDVVATDPNDAIGRVDRAIDDVNRTIGDLRGLIVDLHAEIPEPTDLDGMLTALVEPLRVRHGLDVDLDIATDLADVPGLGTHARTELLLIAREALSNVGRHAQARSVHVGLTHDDGSLRLEVTDDGRGFDPDAAEAAGHFGLSNMRDRAEALGGSYRIEPRAGGGTRIIVRIPTGAPRTGPPATGQEGPPA